MSAKLIQFEAVVLKEGHVLYALDADGQGWVYDGARRLWEAMGTERVTPSQPHAPRPE